MAKLPIGKETTYVTGPLDKEGYIDYEAALNDRLGKGITPEKNANVLLWKAFGPRPDGSEGMPAAFFKRLGIEEPPVRGDYFIDLQAYEKDHLNLDEDRVAADYDDLWQRAARQVWTPKDFPHLTKWLEVNEKPLAVVVKATRRSDYFNPLVSDKHGGRSGALIRTLMPHVHQCREVAHALAARATLRAGEGKFDEAWEDLLACHRLGRLVPRGGPLVATLVGVAIDNVASSADLAYLNCAKLTGKQIRTSLKDLQGLAPLPPLADNVNLAERLALLDSIQLIRRFGLGYLEELEGGESPKKPDPREEKALAAIDWEPGLREFNRWFDRMVAAMRIKDRAGRQKEIERIEKDRASLRKALASEAGDEVAMLKALLGGANPGKEAGKRIGNELIALLFPAVLSVQKRVDRDEQMVERNLHLAFALAAYQRDHGRYPANLDELAPTYLSTIPTDLFSGKALIYRHSTNGYLLYSVGTKGPDDGVRGYDDDLVVRMPAPELKQRK